MYNVKRITIAVQIGAAKDPVVYINSPAACEYGLEMPDGNNV